MPHKPNADDASPTGDQDNYEFIFTISLDIPLPIEVAVGPCEEFQGARDRAGYGQKWMKGKTRLAHRAAWINANGPIPPGMEIMHLCNNPPCCRLSHLKLGTHADNMLHMSISGRGNRSHSSHSRKRIAEAIIANIRSWI